MTKNKFLVVATLLAALVVAVPAYAATKTVVIKAKPPKTGSTFEQRLAQRKAEQKITLASADSKRIVTRCVDVQTKIRTLSDTTNTLITAHTAVYNKIDAKLWVMIGQLKLADKDTFNLEKVRSDYVTKVTAFKDTATYYKQTLDDLVLVKCVTDPTGFKALLETARAYYGQLRTQVTEIRTYVTTNITNSLKDYSDQLQAKLDSTRQ